MKTLALETSIQPGSIALLSDTVTVHSADFPVDVRTTQRFALEMKSAIESLNWNPSDVELFAVCQGPGSFTGLRIGVTAAKTFAYATGSAVLGLDTLEVIAHQALGVADGPIDVIMNAQRGQLFYAQFKLSNQVERQTPTQLIDLERWLSRRGSTLVTGPGVELCADRLSQDETLAEKHRDPQASSLGQLAVQRFMAGTRTDFWNLTPNYFRKSAAEEKWEQRGT